MLEQCQRQGIGIFMIHLAQAVSYTNLARHKKILIEPTSHGENKLAFEFATYLDCEEKTVEVYDNYGFEVRR